MNGSVNVIKAIENNIADHINELEVERTRIISRLLDINRDLVTAYTLAQIVPTHIQKTLSLAAA